jgi:ribonuclease BN (tRNA processing enzyme)
MVVTILGSGTVVPHPERVCSGYWVEVDGLRTLMDCGSGVLHNMARFRLPWQHITHILVSHFHTDHVGDLPSLLFSLKHGLPQARTEVLTVVGPVGTGELFERMAAAFGEHVLDPGFPVRIREVAPGEDLELGDVARLRSRATPHTGASLAYRLEAAGATIGYTGDTGIPDSLAMDTHLTPSRVARIAANAKPRLLVPTHIYPQLETEDVPARLREAGWDGPIRMAADGMRIPIRRNGRSAGAQRHSAGNAARGRSTLDASPGEQ